MSIAIFLINGAPKGKTIQPNEIYKPAGRRGLGWSNIDWLTGVAGNCVKPFSEIRAIYDAKVHRRLMVKWKYDDR